MRRLHLFELEDQPWFPSILRDAGTAYLRFAAQQSGQAARLAPKLAEALRVTGAKRIVDLCSGGAGPLPAVIEVLERQGIEVRAVLTDRYPSEAARRELSRGAYARVSYSSKPVDAMQVPASLDGFRTFFNAFHHFRPADASRILADAVRARQPIGIFELVSREPFTLVALLLSPLFLALTLPFLRPFHWSWLLFTYLVPVIPLFVLWDGLVSWLRVYSPAELREMVSQLGASDYAWQIGRIRLGPAPAHASYLIGHPIEARGPRA